MPPEGHRKGCQRTMPKSKQFLGRPSVQELAQHGPLRAAFGGGDRALCRRRLGLHSDGRTKEDLGEALGDVVDFAV